MSGPGHILLYPAKDALRIVRRRRECAYAAAGAAPAQLDVHAVATASLRLNLDAGRARLDGIVARMSHACSSSIRSSACMASMSPSATMSRYCSPSGVDTGAIMPSPWPSSTMHGTELAPFASTRPCADSPNYTPGDVSHRYLRRDSDDRIVLTSSIASVLPRPL